MSFSSALPRVERLAVLFSRHNYRLTLRNQCRPKTINVPFHSTAKRWTTPVESPSLPLKDILEKLHLSVWLNNVAGVHQYYPALMIAYAKLKQSSRNSVEQPPLNRAQISDILNTLAVSARPFDLELIEKILADMSKVFGFEVKASIHNAIVRGLLKNGNVQTLHHWLMTLPQKPSNFSPTLMQWHWFLEHCIEVGEVGILLPTVMKMHRSGRRPTNETFKILLAVLFQTAPHIKNFYEIIDAMQRARVPYDGVMANILYEGFAKHQLFEHAEEITSTYKERIGSIVRSQSRQTWEWDDKIIRQAGRKGVRPAVSLCLKLMDEGYTPSRHTLTVILKDSQNVEQLRYVEKNLGVEADLLHWSMLIGNAVRAGRVYTALSIYDEVKVTGLRIDTPLVHPIISALCHSTLKQPDDAAIDRALDIYKDLVHATSDIDPTQPSTNDSLFHSRGPDANVYNVLLKTLGSSSNVQKYYPIALSLLEDMQAREVTLDNPMAIAAVLTLLMRCSSSFTEAFDVYKRMCRRHIGPKLDAKAYAAVLNEFCKLSFGNESDLPSVWHYFEIVKDMRAAGNEISVEVYTILLRQLAVLASGMSDQSKDNLLAAIRRVHNHLTLDPSVSPDTALWNQLMDTYQRAGCFAEAYRVWESVYVSGSFDHVSVNIILDACGFAGAWQTAMQICMNLSKLGFTFSQKNWNAWLECMCRLGKLNEAVKAACLEMGKDQKDVAPDIESVRILVSFASRTNQADEVRSRIERYLPELWATLPESLRSG